ncbi:hypothetical protein F5Y14DRAFT_444590 [Nemania sp. NC0429]|nr:hypothetical protein F5Y14DRAFT_444590 [Nemania sp. NC0429]
MGRTEPTVVKPPAAFRRDARAKRARATLNKVIPALLSAHPRAQRGIERSELIVDPAALHQRGTRREGGEEAGEGKYTEHAPLNGDDKKGAASARGVNSPRITLRIADTLTAAQSLLDSPPPVHQRQRKQRGSKEDSATGPNPARAATRVAILNMASPLSPGGGFLNGATSQEESLCMRTTLLPALRDEFYRLPELGVVYTPDVLVFRSSPSSSSSAGKNQTETETETETSARKNASGSVVVGTGGDDEKKDVLLPKNDRWFVDVVSAAMLRLPEIETEDEADADGRRQRYANAADRELAERKMRAVLRVLCARGCNRVVLGAWGCGAYGNPVAEIAAAWRRVLLDNNNNNNRNNNSSKQEPWGAFLDEVVFAIKDAGMAASFARAFGEDILPLPSDREVAGSTSSTTGDGEDDPAEVARVSEIREKIAQLELQAEQVRSPHLKVGLETVLAGLRRQLPSRDDGDDEDEDDGDSDDDNEDQDDEDD